MEAGEPNTFYYKRSRFVTRIPLQYSYVPSHCWLVELGDIWRVGFTKFATRLLGEMVDYNFEAQADSKVHLGQPIGWIEGFKSVSDILSIVEGQFVRSNPDLSQNPELLDQDCYERGWLYEAKGKPDARRLDVEGYKGLLDHTIDQLTEKHQSPE
jgi:glycine cleavage system H protein